MKIRRLNASQVKAFLSKYKTTLQERVLEVGAGNSVGFSAMFPNNTTLDIEPAKKPHVVGDAHALPFENNSFDVVVVSEAFEHFYDPFKAAAEMHRVLRPGGLLLVTTRFTFPVHDAPGDYWRFTPYGMRELFKQFDIIEESVESDAFSTIAILLQRIMFQTKLRGGKFTKGLIYLLALFLNKLDPLILVRYGDIKHETQVTTLLASGVFLACRKRS